MHSIAQPVRESRGCLMILQTRGRGFTLIEILIVIAIIAILAAIAFPSYSRFVERTRRADAREALMRIAAAQERFYTNRNRYTTDIAADLGLGATSEKAYYTIAAAFVGGSDQTYVLTATPQAPQDKDSCKELTINNTGFKGAPSDTGSNGVCW